MVSREANLQSYRKAHITLHNNYCAPHNKAGNRVNIINKAGEVVYLISFVLSFVASFNQGRGIKGEGYPVSNTNRKQARISH